MQPCLKGEQKLTQTIRFSNALTRVNQRNSILVPPICPDFLVREILSVLENEPKGTIMGVGEREISIEK